MLDMLYDNRYVQFVSIRNVGLVSLVYQTKFLILFIKL